MDKLEWRAHALNGPGQDFPGNALALQTGREYAWAWNGRTSGD